MAPPTSSPTNFPGILTGDNGWDAPAHRVVEPDVAVIDVAQLGQHAVDVQALNEHPGEGAHTEVVQEDGDDGAHKLSGDREQSESSTLCNETGV